MKRNIIGASIIIILGLFFANQVFAQTTIKTIDQVINKPLDVVSGTARVEITPTDKTVSDTSIIIKATAKVIQPLINGTIIIFGNNDDVGGISLDPRNPGTNKGSIAIPNIITANDGVIGSNLSVRDLEITGLQKGTTYYFQIKDVQNNVIYEKIAFTTTGTAPNNGQVPPLSTADQKNAIHVTVLNPEITALSADPATKYKVIFKGLVNTDINLPVGLSVSFGDSTGSQIDGGVAFPEKTVLFGASQQINYTLSNFDGGKKYFYKFIDTDTNRKFETPFYSFETPGIPPATSQPVTVPTAPAYDPDADNGVLINNYQLPINIGEPTGDVTSEVSDPGTLVPCGKRSDQSNPEDAHCGFNHLLILFGNVIDYLLILLVPLTALTCIYTGVQMILHRKIPADLVKYKNNLMRIGIGVAVMLLAWTIIATILKTLVGPDASRFILLDIL